MQRILLLGGTREARIIAADLAAMPDCEATLSLAGVTSSPPETGLPTRIGGFGGPEGMAAWIKDNAITTLVDATHPHAAGISDNAARAATMTGIRRLCLWRPDWQPEQGDDWQEYPDWPGLVAAIPDAAVVFLTAGQDGIRALAGESRFKVVARALENPVEATGLTFISSLPARDWHEEATVFRQHGITHLVAKNSGGTASQAKLIAARHLSVPVLMLARPAPPPPPLFADIKSLMQAL